MLPSGLIRFGVSERSASPSSSETLFSTGPSGDFQRRGVPGLYFAEERGEAPPWLESTEQDIREQSSLTFKQKVLMGSGAVFVFWGLTVLMVARDALSLVLIVPGLAMIATPIVKTTKLRRELRAKAESERAAREEKERRDREAVGEFASVLENFQREHGPGAADRVRRSREGRKIPYDAVAPLARETVLHIGFNSVSHYPSLGAQAVAREVQTAIEAVGLREEDEKRVKRHLYQKLVWHLLADDQYTDRPARELEALRLALGISDEDAVIENEAVGHFEFLRGLRVANLPSVDSPVPLKFQEIAHHRSRGELRKPGRKDSWKSLGSRYLTVTSKRVVLSNGKQLEIPHEEIRNIEADADGRLLIIETPDQKHVLAIPDPIYTAGVIAVAMETPRKPKGLA